MEETPKHVVVVEEVLAPWRFEGVEGPLQLVEHIVELLHEEWAWARRPHTRDAVDDLQPLLDVQLHVQRSEYCAN